MNLDRPRFLIPMAIIVGTLWGITVSVYAKLDNRPTHVTYVVRDGMGTRDVLRPAVKPSKAAATPIPTRTARKPVPQRPRRVQPVESASLSPSPTATPRETTRTVPAPPTPTAIVKTPDPTHTDEVPLIEPVVGSEEEAVPDTASTP